MKKNVLALSIAAAVAGFGAMGSAHAITTISGSAGAVVNPANGTTITVVSGATATDLKLNASGIGHMLLVPYFTTQKSNVTLLTVVNTDSAKGKAVKVRFRGAGNSDDLFDFQVFLSPNDVWTASVTKDANGLTQITSADGSCMKGLVKNVTTPFSKLRLDKFVPSDPLVAPTLNNQTREGYVEIFNMADIPQYLNVTALVGAGPATTVVAGTVANPIYAGILHTAGVAPCTGLGALDTDAYGWAGLDNPTTGLMGEWLIINQSTAAGYGGNSTAIQAVDLSRAPVAGNIVYWPQTNVAFTGVSPYFTADPLLSTLAFSTSGATSAVSPAVQPLLQDFPDMSTPYTLTALNQGLWRAPIYQAADLSQSIAMTSVANEFLTETSIQAASDFVFSMPTRRYNVAMNYETLTVAYNDYFLKAGISNFFDIFNTLGAGRKVCVKNLGLAAFDQNEQGQSNVLPSPQTTALFCGEVNVVGVNQSLAEGIATTVLGATVAVQGADAGTFKSGWLRVSTPGLLGQPVGYPPFSQPINIGLPILGGSFTQAVGSASGSNFGVNTDHRATRRTGYPY